MPQKKLRAKLAPKPARAPRNDANLIVRLPSGLLDSYRRECKKTGNSMSRMIRHFIEGYGKLG